MVCVKAKSDQDFNSFLLYLELSDSVVSVSKSKTIKGDDRNDDGIHVCGQQSRPGLWFP